ncbi:uncharacterized protein LOC6557460 [Drosophila grimshawi]|uniref:uncharacterized protein LOC6557460 n=1 Tax=Drosophila grimshawi TaxID=7222 RepID=UPI000C86F6B5|nr:uncharacterized protein LOC6557460 [Drosophila grimshawi]
MHSQNPIGQVRAEYTQYTMQRDRQNIIYSTCAILLMVLVLVTQLSVTSASGVTTTTSTAAPASTSRYDNPLVEHKHERNCKALCEHCGCLGFYCGEECICECNNENSDTECIHTMQVNARTLNTPFKILIQGPSNNRFVRNAQQFEQKREMVTRSAVDPKSTRNRRSTIIIYKPSSSSSSGGKRAALSLNALETPETKAKISELGRHKRSVDHLEWFNDFASSLVRPSPLGHRQKQREAKAAAFKRQAVDPIPRPLREPWFLEQPRLNRPAPLFKRHQLNYDSQSSRNAKKSRRIRPVSIEEEESETKARKPGPDIRPIRDALQVVERIPRVLQDTKIKRKDKKQLSRRRINAKDRDEHAAPAASAVTLAPLTLPAAPLAPGGLLLPWLRQQRLRRLRGH